MSYSLSIPEGPKAGLRSRCEQEMENYLVAAAASSQPVAELREHLVAAVDVADILASVIGLEDAVLAGTIAGHANPGHGPAEGWSDEHMTVSLRVVRS